MNREETVRNADNLLLQGDLEAAIGEYVRLLDEHPQDADLLFALARVELEAGKDLEARTTLTRLLAVAPERHEDVTLLAEGAAARGQVESAFGCTEVAADAAILAGDWTAAVGSLKAFLKCERTHVAALTKLVDVCAEAGMDEELRLAQSALALAQGSFDATAALPGEVSCGSPVSESAPHSLIIKGGEVDLTDALTHIGETPPSHVPRESPAAAPQSLEKVVDGMRSRAGRDQEAAEQYELGMQLLREGAELEAVFHLQSAARVAMWRFSSAAELGRLYIRRGELENAIEWLERAAEAPAPTADEGYEVLYDLASALEGLGEPARSLAVLMELEAAAGGYRDASQRIRRLSRAQAVSPLQ